MTRSADCPDSGPGLRVTPRRRVPTNLILGPLGVGKTTAIRALLAQAPADQRWAVLVNEFGEIGIDAALLGGDERVREVAGGCMCCTAGVATQVAVAQLLRELRPDRLLIEPSGLGHPGGIVDQLRSPTLAAGIELRAIIGLVDVRDHSVRRWDESPLYREQLGLPEILVLTKTALASPAQLADFEAFASALYPPKRLIARERIEPGWLDWPPVAPFAPAPATTARLAFPQARVGLDTGPAAADDAVPEPAFGRHLQDTDGTPACGWRWPPEAGFSRPRLTRLLDGLGALGAFAAIRRAKGVLRTGREWQGFNATPDGVAVQDVAWRRDSRLELIAAPGSAPDWDAIETLIEAARTA